MKEIRAWAKSGPGAGVGWREVELVGKITLVCSGCYNKILEPRCLKQQIFIFLQSWSLEIPDQSAIRVGFWRDFSSWLIDVCLLAMPLWDLPSVLTWREGFSGSSSLKKKKKTLLHFLTILLLFYVLVVWPQGIWDVSSLTIDQTCTPCIGKQSPKHWEVPLFLSLIRTTSYQVNTPPLYDSL